MRRFLPFLLLATMLPALFSGRAWAATSVTLTGDFQQALGCTDNFQADCAATALAFDETHQLWLATFDLPAGSYSYQAVVDGAVDAPVGAAATVGGDPIALVLDEARSVTFWYAPGSGWLADNVNHFLAAVPGNFNSEIGCPGTPLDDPANDGDWAPDCLQTLLQDPDGDGIYTYSAADLPAGDYRAKVALNLSWGENYGDGGAPGGADMPFSVPTDGAGVLFTWDSDSKVITITVEGAPRGNLKQAKAYWVTPDTILTPLAPDGTTFTLVHDPDGALVLTGDGLSGGTAIPLTVDPAGADPETIRRFPHLRQLTALRLPATADAADLLRGQVVLSATDADGAPLDATGLQIPGVLDALYRYDGPLGVTWDGSVPTLRVWAPTAQSVELLLFADSAPTTAPETRPMQRDDATGVWSVTGSAEWNARFYQYRVTVYAPAEGAIVVNDVTDPYALSLSTNSVRAQIVDLTDAALQPTDWADTAKPALDRIEDIVLYELHLRDFSARDMTVPEAHRGTYLAFTHGDSDGMRHLRALAEAGLTHIHLLPVFDIATINEDPNHVDPTDWEFLSRWEPASQRQQLAVSLWSADDRFNWGYDPLHYTVPEGSYSTNPDGPQRITEFRQMVQALNNAGLRVVMDVVYNHTNASGQSDKSVLDRVVPGYYHRLGSNGSVANSTCCANTATEHAMMRKLMIDSVLTWAVQYKVDGFRFDLMGHHMLADMEALRAALDGLTVAEHGVDGSKIYVYGEGWNFGEVADNARGFNATQINVAGTGIGTFNDRIRDAARGGNPFGGEREQGFVTGLFTDPNGTDQGSAEMQRAQLNIFADQIRIGLAGNLADFPFAGADGNPVTGSQIAYGGAPTGYTAQPREHISYVSAHDNETLFDAVQFKAPPDATLDDRVRMQNLGLDLVMFSQGIPFFHAGSDMLRSKSGDRDSYNSGDWFNALDWTYERTGWGVGLPVADKNESKWRWLEPLLADPALRPSREHVLANVAHFRESLQIRSSSPLFRMDSAEQIISQLRFHNTGPDQVPGLIVMSLSDDAQRDPLFDRIVVLFNSAPETVTFSVPELAGSALYLHPVQQNSADPVVRSAAFADGTFTVPGRTTAVFVDAVSDAVDVPESAEPFESPADSAAPTPVVTDSADSAEPPAPTVRQPSQWPALLAALGTGVVVWLLWRGRRRR